MSDLYDRDTAQWATEQAAALRRRSINEIDWDNVAEEIEDLAKRDRRDLHSRVRTILDHLMRLQTSPANDPTRGWRMTIERTRGEIEAILDDSPSLRPTVAAVIVAELPKARRLAAIALEEHGETPTAPLDQISYTEDQVLGP